MYITACLILGLGAGGCFIRYAHLRPRDTKRILAAGLIVAALIYIVFALRAANISLWLMIEFAGVALYGALGFLGMKGSAWWLVAGWALHPVWDVAIHYLGPGASFAPDWYAIACVSFDLLVAAYVAHMVFRGANHSSATW
jgi:hypothetical protein